MLPLSNNPIRIGLGATHLALASARGGYLSQYNYHPLEPNKEHPWTPGINKLAALLSQTDVDSNKVKVSVYLSLELAPLALFPWNESGDVEHYIKLARDYFNSIYGDLGDMREVYVTPTGFQKPWMASSIDRKLIDAFADVLPQIRLALLQPLALSYLRKSAGNIKASDYWLIVPEAIKFSAFYVKNRAICFMRSFPMHVISGSGLKATLERELILSGQEITPCEIYSTAKIQGAKTLIETAWEIDFDMQKFPVHLIGAPE